MSPVMTSDSGATPNLDCSVEETLCNVLENLSVLFQEKSAAVNPNEDMEDEQSNHLKKIFSDILSVSALLEQRILTNTKKKPPVFD